MARKLKELPAQPTKPKKYPYDEWLDGSVWLLEEGKDFSCKVSSIRALLVEEASRRGSRLRTRSADGGVAIQAVAGKPKAKR